MKPKFFPRLSAFQIKGLCSLASKAYKAAKARGACDDLTAEEFRRQGQLEAAGITSLKDATQQHYLSLKGKWFTIIGNLEEAFYCFLNEGPQLEAARQKKFLLMGYVANLAAVIGGKHKKETGIDLSDTETARQAWAYTASIASDKFAGRRIETLDADELEQLMYTIVNRTNAKRGVGSSETRNKAQSRKVPAPEAPPESSRLPTPPQPGMSMIAQRAAALKAASSRI